MEEIRCPNCGNVLDQMESYGMLYPDNGITECCIFGCYNCGKEYQIDLHYKYVSYSIEGENQFSLFFILSHNLTYFRLDFHFCQIFFHTLNH